MATGSKDLWRLESVFLLGKIMRFADFFSFVKFIASKMPWNQSRSQQYAQKKIPDLTGYLMPPLFGHVFWYSALFYALSSFEQFRQILCAFPFTSDSSNWCIPTKSKRIVPLYLLCLVFLVMHYVCSTNGKENKCNLQPHAAILSKGALLYHPVCLSAIKTTTNASE